MAETEKKTLKRRLAGAWLSSLVSISLVLLLVGFAALLLVNAEEVSRYFKENLKVSVILKTEADENDAHALRSDLQALPWVKMAEVVSREQGQKEMEAMLGEDFLNVFETSPVPVSIDLSLNANYVSADSLEVVKTQVSKSPIVDEVIYQQSLVEALGANMKRISLVFSAIIVLLLFISYVLINNTVRLSVHARRFTIHTMRLVGATKSFIRRPFMWRSAVLGLFSSLIAIILLLGLLTLFRKEFPALFAIINLRQMLAVISIVLASGVIICTLSTALVVDSLTGFRKDDLYY